MSWGKMLRLVKRSVHMYMYYFKKNIYLTISISVSLLIFLAVALYADFSFANYKKSYQRIQKDYVVIKTTESETLQMLLKSFRKYNHVVVTHGGGSGVIHNKTLNVKVDYNIIVTQSLCSGLSICSGLEEYGGTSVSNVLGYEKYYLKYGRDIFYASNEIIISEDYAKMFFDRPEDALGMQISMGIDGPEQVFVVVGIYEGLLTERRINKNAVRSIRENEESVDEIVYSVFMPEKVSSDWKTVNSDIYLFFNSADEYNDIVKDIWKIEKKWNRENNAFTYLTPEQVEQDLRFEYRSSILLKVIIMLIVAIISGISVYGNMQNSILDRKREIGIKRAVGASDLDIMGSFLVENIITSFFAMWIALNIASIIVLCYCWYQRRILLNDYIVWISSNTVLLFACYAFSSIIGFSLVPAYRATQVNIINTLREE